jgi:ABC-type nitrate/sulfonate/bicarbonate transport system substrate-binding protein
MRGKEMKLRGYISAPIIAVLALVGCAQPTQEDSQSSDESQTGASETDELFKIVVGISPFQDTYIPIIGQEKGWFEEVGLEVELKSLAWNAVTPAIISGDVDMAVNNTTGVVAVANAEPDLVYVYGWNPFTEGSALMIRPESGLKSIDQFEEELGNRADARTATIEGLRGRTIVTTLATDMGKQINDALTSVGMTDADVNFVDMDPDAGLAAFLSGTGDAYLGGIPQRFKSLEEGMMIGISGPDLAPPPINGLLSMRDFVTENEDQVLAFLNVIHRIVRFCDAETAECGQIITDRLNQETAAGLTVDGFESFWQNIELYATDANSAKEMILDETGVAYWKATWDSDNAYLVGTDAIPAPVDAESNFLMPQIWEAYVAKYGSSETGF